MALQSGGRTKLPATATEEYYYVDASSEDVFSQVLSAVEVDSTALYLFELADPWAFEIERAPFYIAWTVIEGSMWLLNVEREPICFHQGDTFLLLGSETPREIVMASAPDLKPMSISNLWMQAQKNGWKIGDAGRRAQHVRWNGPGPVTRVMSATFSFNDNGLGLFLSALPRLIVLRSAEHPDLVKYVNGLLGLMANKEAGALPGYSALATQTSKLVLMFAIRAYALTADKGTLGALIGLGDPQIARALRSIHEQPDRAWTVASLARVAGMSRSLFAERFREQVGHTPKHYLSIWRMNLARDALAGGKVTVTALAYNLGYQSTTAFRAAFRRIIGCTPRDVLRKGSVKSS